MLEYVYGGRAADSTTGTLATRPLVIKSSGTVYVTGIHVKSNIGRTITFQDKDSNTYLTLRTATVGIGPSSDLSVHIPWAADNGLQVTTTVDDANTIITVFHRNLAGS